MGTRALESGPPGKIPEERSRSGDRGPEALMSQRLRRRDGRTERGPHAKCCKQIKRKKVEERSGI